MHNIFINAVSAKIGGGKNILDNFISQLSQTKLYHTYYILTPNYENYKQYEKENLNVIDIAGFYKKNILFLILYFVKFPILLKKYKIDLIFNFGDVIIPTKKKQIYFFDWPYAVYTAKYIWNRMEWKDYIVRKIKIFFIKKYIFSPECIIAQTRNIENRLKNLFLLQNIIIIPTPISIKANIIDDKLREFYLPSNKKKYLYPANYMSHKNFDIIIPLAEKINAMNLSMVIIITVDETIAIKFIKKIKSKNLDCIINVGKIEGKFMPSLYNQCDAVLFPSLLETYGLPYVEAMAYEKPIITSDLDFAHDICEDVAYYFNPFDVDSILTEMQKAFSNEEERTERIKKGKLKAQNLPDWKTVVEQFQQEIDIVINS